MQVSEATFESYAKENDANAEFWNELCGSQLAQSLGITDNSPASLRRFDDWYFNFYPYLQRYLPLNDVRGKSLLEVGLGYGTVAQKLAESGVEYHGLDVAAGPVSMVNHRLRSNGHNGLARQGSVLNAPFEDEAFDHIVAIGCYHHTGDVQRAVDESFRMLKPGGQLMFMVYYAYSYRRWLAAPSATLASLCRERLGWMWAPAQAAQERAAYDINTSGVAAPITAFLSKRSLSQICRRFSSFEATLENASPEGPLRRLSRDALINSSLARVAGLDAYVSARK